VKQQVAEEVRRQHDILATWLGTDCDADVLDRFRAAHDDAFTMVTTEGAVLGLGELFAALEGARNAQPGLVIDVDRIEIVTSAGNLTVVRFTETHRVDGRVTERVVTAVLRDLRWLHVHETSVP